MDRNKSFIIIKTYDICDCCGNEEEGIAILSASAQKLLVICKSCISKILTGEDKSI